MRRKRLDTSGDLPVPGKSLRSGPQWRGRHGPEAGCLAQGHEIDALRPRSYPAFDTCRGMEGPLCVTSIFISYRRDDTFFKADRLFEDLSQRFGKENVFRDIDSIAPGEDFVD